MKQTHSFIFILLAVWAFVFGYDPAGFAGSTWDLYSFANNDPKKGSVPHVYSGAERSIYKRLLF